MRADRDFEAAQLALRLGALTAGRTRRLDLIRDNVRADIGYIFAGDFANIAYIPRSLFKEGSDGFASAFAGLEAGAKEKSAALIALFGNK